jgi:hypothetical protein
MKCDRCLGSGKIANTEEGEPWSHWENLPLRDAQAVLIGLVKPVDCPKCKGIGSIFLEGPKGDYNE